MKKDFLNFSVGPVQMYEEELEIGAKQPPYFRTDEFSKITLENEKIMKKLVKTEDSSKVIFLTNSGTGAMEAVVMNVFTKKDKVLVVNGGSFGHRFVELCKIHEIPFEEIKLSFGQALTKEILDKYKNKGFTGFLVNAHETSTGVLYDLDLIGNFCKEEKLFLVVDAISAFLADDINMKENNINVMITGSQKALALPAGMALVVVDKKAVERIENNDVKSMYFNLKDYLNNGKRGQTPFTPAVSIILQLNSRLKRIEKEGLDSVIKRTKEVAESFREKIKGLPLEIANESPSNAVTPLRPTGKMTAYEIFKYMKDNYNIFLCPNGGELSEVLFRVGHIGAISDEDIDELVNAFKDMNKKGVL